MTVPKIQNKTKVIEGQVSRKSQIQVIQVHCKLSLTSAFGHGLVPIVEADYYKGWSDIRKVQLNLGITILCAVLVSLSSVFALKTKSDIYSLNNRSVSKLKCAQS